jgi:hypothetical protein
LSCGRAEKEDAMSMVPQHMLFGHFGLFVRDFEGKIRF